MKSRALANSVFMPKIAGDTTGEDTAALEGPPLTTPQTSQDSSHTTTGAIPLNVFQRLLRGWEVVHPYNAAQVMEIRRELDPAAASAAWAATLDELQLGRVEIRKISYRHICLNGQMNRYPVRVLPPDTCLEAFVAAELNRRFDDPGEPPFRPFLWVDATAGAWHFGVVYQHWVADSVAVRHLLRRWLERAFQLPPQRRTPRIRHANIGYLGLLGLAAGPFHPAQTMLSLFRRHWRYRRARKCKTLGKRDLPVGVVMRDVPALIGKVVSASKRLDVKVNDLFLAAAMRACDGRIPTQVRKQRTDLAIGSIIDLRPLARGALDDRFGLFLGFAEVICGPKLIRSPRKLLADIATQNRLHRLRGIWPSSVGYLMLAMVFRPVVKPRKLYSFFRKEAPLIAGVSNVNLTSTWVGQCGDLIAGYRRVSPTGPLAPVVFAVTSLGDRMQLSITHRLGLLSSQQARELGDAFVAELVQLTDLD